MGTAFVLSGSYSWTSFAASLVPFFLVSDLLLLNQFPDMEADKGVGRRHIIIVMGKKAGVRVYGVFLAGAFATIIFGYLLGLFPLGSLLALATLVIAIPTVIGVSKYTDDIPKLMPYMGRNVVINILTPVLLAIGLFISR
jgi:1,4-dihydroxy-2-naphthoate octaprenyltransferase